MRTIDLTRADSEPLVFEWRVPLPEGCGGDAVADPGDVRLTGTVERASEGFILAGEIEGQARVRCSRCLAEFDFPYRERVEVHLVPAANAPRDEDARLGRDELNVRFYADAQIDVVELASEQVELALPMKPLCTQGCQGICAQCGANLNLNPCTCTPAVDDRLAPLLNWRQSDRES